MPGRSQLGPAAVAKPDSYRAWQRLALSSHGNSSHSFTVPGLGHFCPATLKVADTYRAWPKPTWSSHGSQARLLPCLAKADFVQPRQQQPPFYRARLEPFLPGHAKRSRPGSVTKPPSLGRREGSVLGVPYKTLVPNFSISHPTFTVPGKSQLSPAHANIGLFFCPAGTR